MKFNSGKGVTGFSGAAILFAKIYDNEPLSKFSPKVRRSLSVVRMLNNQEKYYGYFRLIFLRIGIKIEQKIGKEILRSDRKRFRLSCK